MKPRYFSHDFDAGRDSKILKMRSDKWGPKGVGLYWLTIEYLFSVDGKARLDELKLAATYIGEPKSVIEKFIHACISKYELFTSDGDCFWSERLLSELDNIKRRTNTARENASKRIQSKSSKPNEYKEINDSQAKQQFSNSSAIAQPQLSRGPAKEGRKENKEKKDIYGEFSNVSLSAFEYEKCVEKKGEQVTLAAIEFLSSYKASEGKQYKSDYACLCRWVFDAVIKKNPEFRSSKEGSELIPFTPRIQKSVWDDEDFKKEVSQ